MSHNRPQTHGNGANFNDSRRVDKLTTQGQETATECEKWGMESSF